MKTGLDYVRALMAHWKTRADGLRLPAGHDRDERCLEFFMGAAALSTEMNGARHPTTVALLKVCIYVVSVRGERGLDEHLKPSDPGRASWIGLTPGWSGQHPKPRKRESGEGSVKGNPDNWKESK